MCIITSKITYSYFCHKTGWNTLFFFQFSIYIPIHTPICSQLIDFIFNRDINFLHTNVLQQQLYNRFKKVYETNPCNVLLLTVKKIQTCCVIIFNKFRAMIFNKLKQTSKFLKFLSLIEGPKKACQTILFFKMFDTALQTQEFYIPWHLI